MLRTLAVHGYRSLRELVVPLAPITVITGENGVGKSSLYRSLALLAETAQGGMVQALAREGGLARTLWAGPEHISGAMKRGEVPIQGTGSRSQPVSLGLGFATDDWGYLIDVGLPIPSTTAFARDPIIKRESIFAAPVLRPATALVTRKNHTLKVAAERGWRTVADDCDDRVSVLAELGDPQQYPELLAVRRQVQGWRLYDHFRTDALAPARQPHIGTWTPVMAADGADLAPAIQSILESSWADLLRAAVAEAFPGGELAVLDRQGRFELEFTQTGLLRPLNAAELSDGTLRFLLLATCLLAPRAPSLLVLNEPETSLHPQVLPTLARLIERAAQRTQVVVVSHSAAIVDHLIACQTDPDAADPDATNPDAANPDAANPDACDRDPYDVDDPDARVIHHRLTKQFGETIIDGQGLLNRPSWHWGSR